MDKLPYFEDLTYQLPKSVILELLRINEKNLLKNYKIEEINEFIDFLEELPRGVMGVDLYQNIEKLSYFLINLIEIKEITLAKKIFDIANEYKFRGQIAYTGYSFNKYLVQILALQKNNVVDTLLKFLGEDNFLKEFEMVAIYKTKTNYIKQLLPKLIDLEKYDLLIKILNLISKAYNGSNEIINMILPLIHETINTNNNNLLLKYVNILSKKFRFTGRYELYITNELIKKAELNKS